MRKISLVCVGKNKPVYIQKGVDGYLKRLSAFGNFETVFIKEHSKGKISVDEIQKKETFTLIEQLNKRNSIKVLLDAGAKSLDSLQWSVKLQKLIDRGKDLDFIIGGAYGVDSSIANSVDEKLSLSAMTFNHQLIRIMFLEQLYRGLCLIKNIPYHK